MESEALSSFVTYGGIVLLKMVIMSPLTAYYRFKHNVFANKEDLVGVKGKDKTPIFNNPDVERVRRSHLNDLENIVPFFGLGLLYAIMPGPALSTIVWHYRAFALSRILHTFVYVGAIPQPSRALCFMVGMIVNVSMAVQLLKNNAVF